MSRLCLTLFRRGNNKKKDALSCGNIQKQRENKKEKRLYRTNTFFPAFVHMKKHFRGFRFNRLCCFFELTGYVD